MPCTNCNMEVSTLLEWEQKQTRERNQKMKHSKIKGEVYLGPTTLSNMVAYKVREVQVAIERLLDPDELRNPKTFGKIWEYLYNVRAFLTVLRHK